MEPFLFHFLRKLFFQNISLLYWAVVYIIILFLSEMLSSVFSANENVTLAYKVIMNVISSFSIAK